MSFKPNDANKKSKKSTRTERHSKNTNPSWHYERRAEVRLHPFACESVA